MQLAYMGLTIILGRLTLDMFDPSDEADAREVAASISSSLDLVESVIAFVEAITPEEVSGVFWISCMSLLD